MNGRICLLLQERSVWVLPAREVVGKEAFLLALGDHVYSDGCVGQVLAAHRGLTDEAATAAAALTGAVVCSEAEIASTGLLQLGDGEGVVREVVRIEKKPVQFDAFEMGTGSGNDLSQLGMDVLQI